MEDCFVFKDILEYCLKMYEKYLGEDHWKMTRTLINLDNVHGKLDDHNK